MMQETGRFCGLVGIDMATGETSIADMAGKIFPGPKLTLWQANRALLWCTEGGSIQDLLPDLDADGRELFLTGIKTAEWNELYGDKYENHYRCCGDEWIDTADSMHNDRCAACNSEVEPYKSVEIVR